MGPDRFLLIVPPGVPLIISRASTMASRCLGFLVARAALTVVSSTWAVGSLGGHPKGKLPERESDQISQNKVEGADHWRVYIPPSGQIFEITLIC